MNRLRLFLLLTTSVAFGLVAGYDFKIAALILAGSSLSAAIYFRPMFGIYLVLLGMPFLNVGFRYNNPVRLVDEFIPIGVIPIVLTGLVYSIKRLTSPRASLRGPEAGPERTGLENQFLLLIVLFTVASLFWTIDFTHGIVMLFLLFSGFWIYKMLPQIISTERDVTGIFWFIVLLSPVLAALLLISHYHYDYMYKVNLFKDTSFVVMLHTIVASGGKIRLGGFAPVNVAANILTIVFFAIVYLVLRASWAARVGFAGYSAFLMYCLIKTGSKAGLATLVFGGMALLVMVPEFRKRLLTIIYAGTMVVGLFLVVAGQALLKRVELIASGKVSEIRLEWWATGFRHLLDTYGIGLGAGGFPRVIDPIPAAHSFYLSILFDFGIPGTILFIFLFGSIISKVRRSAPAVSGDMKLAYYCLMAEMVAMTIHATVDADYIYFPFWIILGIIMSILKIPGSGRSTAVARGQWPA